jgi:tRNA dimethylallyltransferase
VSKPQDRPKVIAIVGPTASGKSALGVFLAQKLKGEVISADSRQVYKGLTIGTGKVTKKEMTGIPHHLLDVASPKKVFTASDFVQHASKTITAIHARGAVPIVVGGTGFYIDSLFGRFTLPEVPPNKKLRVRLERKSAPQLFALLQKKDPARAATIDKHNPVRLVRALEIAAALGKNPLPTATNKYDVLWLGVTFPKSVLEKRIHARLRARMKQGMVAEVKQLRAKGLSYKRMEMLGLEYRYLALYLQGKLSKEEMYMEIKTDDTQYAKRQLTWFKKNKEIVWIENKSQAARLAKQFLKGSIT